MDTTLAPAFKAPMPKAGNERHHPGGGGAVSRQPPIQERITVYAMVGIGALLLGVEPRPPDMLPALGSMVVFAVVYALLCRRERERLPMGAFMLMMFCNATLALYVVWWWLSDLPAAVLAALVPTAAVAWTVRSMRPPWSQDGGGADRHRG